jgi:acyl-coenzyme A thioesterase PaaI-like protein
MTGRFATATAVTLLERDVRNVETVRYDAEVHDGWDIGGNANGGYLLAIAGRAMADAVGRPPLTITAHYLRPAPPGPCTVDVDIIRSGRRLATVSATLSMAGVPTLQLLGTFGDQQPGGPMLQQVDPVELPPFDECPLRPQTAEVPALMANLDSRIHPDDGTYALGHPTGTPLIRGWFAHADGEPIDAYSLLLAADAFPPPVFNTDVPVAWVPTIELTVHIRGVPSPGPLRCSFRSRFIHDGLLDEDGEIWDSSGALVCQSRQLSLMPRPPE